MEVIAHFSRRSWGGTRDKLKNVCVGGYSHTSLKIVECVSRNVQSDLCTSVQYIDFAVFFLIDGLPIKSHQQ